MNSESVTQATGELYKQYVLPCYGRFDLFIDRGEGCRVWDEKGKEYLDFGAGIAVCSIGHANPAVTKAITVQASQLVHVSNLYYTRPQAELAKRLVEFTGEPGKVFFCNSGAEANEGLIKLARKFGSQTGGRFGIITFNNSFHGRTMAGISATGQDKVKKGFAPLLDGFSHVPFGDLDAVAREIDSNTVAILVEPMQGEGGIHVATPGFLLGLQKLCRENNLLLLFDEVQCGLGRTGNWCAWKSIVGDQVVPDGVSWAKGIANGFPLGAFWIRDREINGGSRLWELLGPGSHGTTYGGNPVACAAGLAVIDVIKSEGLLVHAVKAGELLRESIRNLKSPAVVEIRGCGLMVGIELAVDFLEGSEAEGSVASTPAMRATLQLMKDGFLVIPAGERTIRLLPPLNVSEAEIAEAVEKLRRLILG